MRTTPPATPPAMGPGGTLPPGGWSASGEREPDIRGGEVAEMGAVDPETGRLGMGEDVEPLLSGCEVTMLVKVLLDRTPEGVTLEPLCVIPNTVTPPETPTTATAEAPTPARPPWLCLKGSTVRLRIYIDESVDTYSWNTIKGFGARLERFKSVTSRWCVDSTNHARNAVGRRSKLLAIEPDG